MMGGIYMPFVEINIKETIEKEKQISSEFAKAWDESRTDRKSVV